MHVVVTGDRLAEVEAAALLIDDLLRPIDDDTNEWKKRQLMELAIINGTMKDLSAPCSRCGEPGHRHYECPYEGDKVRRAGVRCALCGDGGHITAAMDRRCCTTYLQVRAGGAIQPRGYACLPSALAWPKRMHGSTTVFLKTACVSISITTPSGGLACSIHCA
jgi:hypothetical protein